MPAKPKLSDNLLLKSARFSLVLPLLAGLIILGHPTLSRAQYIDPNEGHESARSGGYNSFSEAHQAGVRIGGWGNLGDDPADTVILSDELNSITDIGSASFYMEGFMGWRVSRMVMIEASLGIVSRGDISGVEVNTSEEVFGSLIVYPILLKAKLYPLGGSNIRLHPYFLAGGGIYYTNYDIQFTTAFASPLLYDSPSKTSIDYVLGAGFDYPLASVIGLDFNVQYMPIDYSSELFGLSDFSSFTATLGIKYLFNSSKKK